MIGCMRTSHLQNGAPARFNVGDMSKMIEIEVPDGLPRMLKIQAAAEGISLSDLIKRELGVMENTLSFEEIAARVKARGPSKGSQSKPSAHSRSARRHMTVVDASVLVEYLAEASTARRRKRSIGRERRALGSRPDRRRGRPGAASAGTGRANHRRQGARRARRPSRDAAASRPAPHLVERAWELRDNVSFYDGLYVALAEAMDAPLLTTDRKLAAAPGLRVRVELIAPV